PGPSGGGTRDPGATKKIPTIRISPPTLDRGRAYLSTDGPKVMHDVSGLPENVSQAVVDGRNALRDAGKLPSGAFTSVQQVLDGIKLARPRFDLAEAETKI